MIQGICCNIFIHLREPNPNFQHVNKPYLISPHEVLLSPVINTGEFIMKNKVGGLIREVGLNRGFTVLDLVVQKPINTSPILTIIINQGVYFSTPKCCSMLIFGKTFH